MSNFLEYQVFNNLGGHKEDKQKCLHDDFNEKLMSSGHAKTIEQANSTPRMIACPCPKCRPMYHGKGL